MVESFEEAEGAPYPASVRRVLLGADFEMAALETLGWEEEPWGNLPGITVPTLLLAGSRGDPDGNNARWAKLMPDAHSVTLPGLGHIGAWLHSDLVLPHVLSFLRQVLPSS